MAENPQMNSRDTGLGLLAMWSDEMVHDFLFRLEARDLVALQSVSKALYVFAGHEELWRDLTVRRFAGDFWFQGTWRRTFAHSAKAHQRRLDMRSDGLQGGDGGGGENEGEDVVRDAATVEGIRVKGFYSDFLFQSWYCSSRRIDPGWLQVDNIERRSGLSVEEFIRQYEEPNRPVVLTDVVNQWPAFKLWTKEYLLENFGEVTFRAEAVDITLGRYLRYANTTTDEGPIYLFDRFFCDHAPKMRDQFEVPPYFREDLFSVVGPNGSERPDYRWLIMGPARSGSTFHKDPNSTSAWNAVITGSKKWILYPPEIVPPGVFPSQDGAEVTTSVSLMEWFANFYPHTQGATGSAKPIECICRAGELMFIPNGWWHTVLNLEESIAITQNYVSGRNLRNVLNFIHDCGDQVSGYRGTESLHSKFVRGLEDAGHGEALRRIQEQDESEAKALLESKVWDKLKSPDTGSTFSFGFDLEAADSEEN